MRKRLCSSKSFANRLSSCLLAAIEAAMLNNPACLFEPPFVLMLTFMDAKAVIDETLPGISALAFETFLTAGISVTALSCDIFLTAGTSAVLLWLDIFLFPLCEVCGLPPETDLPLCEVCGLPSVSGAPLLSFAFSACSDFSSPLAAICGGASPFAFSVGIGSFSWVTSGVCGDFTGETVPRETPQPIVANLVLRRTG